MKKTGSMPLETSKRRKRFTRDITNLQPIQLTTRDIRTIEAVYEHRALTLSQLYALLFAPMEVAATSTVVPSAFVPNSRCRNRLKLLFHYGFVARREQPFTFAEGPKTIIYLLDMEGAKTLAFHYGVDVKSLDWTPKANEVKPQFLAHLLASNDIRIAVTLAARHQGYTLPTWRDEATLRKQHMVDTVTITSERGSKQKVAIVPDDYFILETATHRLHHFVEIDMGTVTIEAKDWQKRDWERKVKGYLAYHNSGRYKERYGSEGLRILTVTSSAQRLENLKAMTEHAGGKFRFWFTTFAKATPAAILTEPIWSVASKDGLYSLTR